MVSCTGCFRNNKRISSAYSTAETKKATIRLLRTIIVLTQSLSSLPDNVMMTMKLLYYDDSRHNQLTVLNLFSLKVLPVNCQTRHMNNI